MSAILIGFFAASGGVVAGLLLGACLAAGKLRDLEAAYECLSHNVRMFVRSYLAAEEREMIPVARHDFHFLRQSLLKADRAVGLAWPEDSAAARQDRPFS